MLAFSLVILLLNLLIAVMNEAYEEVKNTAEARWCYIQFRTILRNRKLTLGTKTPDKLGRKSTSKPTKDSASWLNWLFQRGNQNEDKFLTLGKCSLARNLANLDKNTLGNDTYFIPDKKSRSNFRLKKTFSKVSPVYNALRVYLNKKSRRLYTWPKINTIESFQVPFKNIELLLFSLTINA
eukprot:snap_masked-scaffold_11-processed-gene-1.44-mRNA-1 protein AED:1.00 eAED:1.00 QI:0/-1/0/0/-1/1/1/0/180